MTDQIIRDIPLIARYSRHNEAADWRFAAHIKTGLNCSDSKLDSIVQEETERVVAQIDCTTCGNCCRTLQIIVDSNDIARLAKRLNTTSREFSRRYVKTDPLDQTKHFASTPCKFLGSDNRCTVYEDRPQACRDFPYLHADKFRSRALTMLSNVGMCPIVFNVWQGLKAKLWGQKVSGANPRRQSKKN
jgi:Fe-S-cluster containining protein